jgi:hypothetical protein
VLAGADNFGEAVIFEIDGVLNAAFAAEFEMNGVAMHLGMAVAKGCEAEGMILFRLFDVADANEGSLKKLNDGGEDFGAGEAAQAKIAPNFAANFWEGAAEVDHAFILVFILRFAPKGMIEILFAAALVAPDGLDVAVRIGADSHVLPGGGNDEAADSAEGSLIVNRLAGGANVYETVAVAAAGNCAVEVRYIMKSAHWG